MNVTFIGLGIMGSRMAANLLQHGANLTVYNRSQAPARALGELGARIAASARDAVDDADVVFTMLSSPEAVTEVALGDDGFLPAMKPNALWADCSTVNPSFSQEEAAAARARGLRFLDAPVAGSAPQAEKGELVFFVGGDAADVKEAEELIGHMGSKLIHVGETGRGTSLKMLVNSLLAQSMLVFAETLALGEKMGLSREFLLDTLPNLPVAAPFLKAKAEMIRAGDYGVQFPLELMHKDLHLAALTAYEHGQPLNLANAAKELYAAARQEGLGREDFASIYEYLRGK
ncbi:MAG: NAD(P)-dependent oxidoreductase [Acidihalobacter sp.]|jgi:3-hydroxyisobutyrate dehydrogenase-like beta-hydroxyacid dehydrogenase